MVNGLPVGRRDPEPGEAGVEIGQQDHPPKAVGALLDDAPGLGALGRERRVALGRRSGASGRGSTASAIRSVPPVTRTLWKSISGDVPPPGPFLRPSTSSKFIRPLRSLMSWMRRVIELHAAQQDLAREQVGQPVGHPHARQIGEQRARGVAHDQVLRASGRRGTSPRSRPPSPARSRSGRARWRRCARAGLRPGGVSVIDVTTPSTMATVPSRKTKKKRAIRRRIRTAARPRSGR